MWGGHAERRIVRWRGVADFGQFDGRPGSQSGKGNIGIDDSEIIAFGEADDVFIVQVMGEQAGDGMEIGEVAVIEHAIVNELDGRETHGRHEVVGLGLGDQRPGGIHLNVRLGYHRCQILVLGVDSESFQPVGSLGEDYGMETHPRKVITKYAGINAVVKALDPAPGLLIVVNLMFGAASFSLCDPELEEVVIVNNVAVILRPFSEGFPTGTVNGAETTQLAELLRELRDFR
jgi:hypothetical protein